MDIPSCAVCPRRCHAHRTADSGGGYCRLPADPTLARAALHFGEEPCLSGVRGSGAVFFSGCSLGCVFCQNDPISHGGLGETVAPRRLAEIFRELTEAGAHNINLVNPTPHVPAIIRALELYKPPVPIIYNTGGYDRVETLRALEGAVDVYLPDLKYMHGDIARRFSGAADYFENASAAILEMARQTGPMELDDEGLARRGTLVRHLVLPGHIRETMDVLDWMALRLPKGVWISLLFQYTPVCAPADYPELNRRLTRRECDKAFRHLEELGLTDGYVQERESAGTRYIPAFDLTGVREKA